MIMIVTFTRQVKTQILVLNTEAAIEGLFYFYLVYRCIAPA